MSGEKRSTDHLEPAAKKRGSERQLTKDDAEEEEDEVVVGTFQRADNDTLKHRKIVRARRAPAADGANPFANVQLAPAAAPAPAPAAANPFAGITLVPPAAPKPEEAATVAPEPESTAAQEPVEAQVEPAGAAAAATAAGEADGQGAAENQAAEENPAAKEAEKPSSGGFGALAGGLGGGLAFGGFGAAAAGGFGSLASSAAAPAFGASSNGAFNFGSAAPAGASAPAAASSVFGSAAATGTSLFGGGAPSGRTDLPAPAATATGEEKERTLFSADGVLFEWDAAGRWRERGRGEARVNVDDSTGQGRIVMRQKGNLRLLLNGNLWPHMQITRLEGGAGVSFAVANHLEAGSASEEGAAAAPKLAPYALRIKAPDVLERFIVVVEQHKQGGSHE